MTYTVSSFSFRDWSNELGVVSVNAEAIAVDGANYDAQNVLRLALRIATEALVLGAFEQEQTSIITRNVVLPAVPPTAQREKKFIVSYRDVTPALAANVNNPGYGKYFNIEIPCANDTQAAWFLAGKDQLNLNDNGPVEAWVAAFEAYAKSPYGGTPKVVEITFSGTRS